MPVWTVLLLAAASSRGAASRVAVPAVEAADRTAARGVVLLREPAARWVRHPGGTFTMGSLPADMQDAMKMCTREPLGTLCLNQDGARVRLVRNEGHAHPVTLSTFEIQRREVSVEEYGRCVGVGTCPPAASPTGDRRFTAPELPVTHVRWEDAAAYCAWIGGRLPTEAEWEYAARGAEGRRFPWGAFYNPHLANHGSLAVDDTDLTDGYAGLAPVDSFPDGATPLGVLNLAGNVSEWVEDPYTELAPDGFGYEPAPRTNPRGPSSSSAATAITLGHTIRGGSYQDPAWQLRGAARQPTSVARAADVGFRCAREAR